ncbi:DnaJ C-terminal domain-containing protein [Dermatophilus congolensis]|uniref:Curved DNA-binding protein n=1 Tax=Dermatophilus congolensis TaxID=1863 RepID=A0AA46BP77_9MICO|nr:DnaJ C-terminal domain-containing protein [Dermatophilus congolensis]MBO3143491.1 DnaJ domain-containing protein [Dermatophilus congolensis]MBO3152482.1 DnaJ domain-containing protein [Dermatophilus congolensis]MBO3160507.1 DnaJ domain-containing protein [Dermatophilus congolensis]MBO3163768.1 DnaJ domain-containing protein [Dermatophilus congolensis]MBO3177314.1 DnaJ domain-containing protein [Dermatophilus congolensis]
MASQDWLDKDFYAVLGVKPGADDKEIKKQYRKMAREYHPDTHKNDPVAEAKFKEIGEAYAVLSDAEQRRQYDAIRAMGGGGPRFTAGGPGGMPGGGAGFDDLLGGLFGNAGGFGGARRTAGAAPNLEDLLGMFGQQGSGAGNMGFGTAGTRPPKGRDVHATATLSFKQAVNGDTVVVNGVSGKPITARIPAGVKDGATIRLRGKGESSPMAGGEAGDILLKVTVKPHPVFRLEGNDLVVDVPVTFAEAALGATISVPTLGGNPVKLKLPAGTPSGRSLRVRGRGVPAKGTPGDLRARIQVTVPQRLTDEARAAIEALRAQESDFDPRAELLTRARGE